MQHRRIYKKNLIMAQPTDLQTGPHICEHCGENLIRKQHLIEHAYFGIHKPYKCQHCSETSTRKLHQCEYISNSPGDNIVIIAPEIPKEEDIDIFYQLMCTGVIEKQSVNTSSELQNNVLKGPKFLEEEGVYAFDSTSDISHSPGKIGIFQIVKQDSIFGISNSPIQKTIINLDSLKQEGVNVSHSQVDVTSTNMIFQWKKHTGDNSNTARHVKIHTREYDGGINVVLESSMRKPTKIPPGKLYKCKICDRGFKDEIYATHTHEKQYKCVICDKGFVFKSNMIKHFRRIHTQEKLHNFLCEYCGKSFTFKSDIIRHLRMHSGEKPYKCEHCSKCFTRKPYLLAHAKIRHTLNHTGEKPYKCDYCDKRFTQKCSMERHSSIHTGEKPYKCKHCDKGFTHKSNMERHTRIQVKTYTNVHIVTRVLPINHT